MSEPADGASDEARVDVVQYPSGEVKAVPAGKGAAVVRSFQDRDRSRGYLRRAGLAAIALLVFAYALLVARALLVGIVAAVLLYGVGVLLPRLTGGDAELLDEAVTMRDAREQWEATPVSALTDAGGGRRRERERGHAVEGEV